MRLRVFANPFVALPVWALNLVALAPARSSTRPQCGTAAVHAVEHIAFFARRHRPLAARARDAPGARVVRDGREARLHRRRPPRRDRSIGNVFIWGGAAFYGVYDTGDDYLGLSPSRGPEPRGVADDARGLGRHHRRHRVALPAHGAGGRGAPGAASSSGVDERTARRAVRYRRWQELTCIGARMPGRDGCAARSGASATFGGTRVG